MVDSNKKSYVVKEGSVGHTGHSMSSRAVHTKVVVKEKPSGFKDKVSKEAKSKMENDTVMKNHVRDDAKAKKKNPKKLEKSMSLQVREYLAQVEEKVAKVPAKEIGLQYGYDIDNPENTLQDLIDFTGNVSKACNAQADYTDVSQEIWASTTKGNAQKIEDAIGETYEDYVQRTVGKFEDEIAAQEQAELEAAMNGLDNLKVSNEEEKK